MNVVVNSKPKHFGHNQGVAMKEGWQTKTLGDVCHVYQPETISQKQMKAGEFRVYGANGQIGWHNAFNHDSPQLILGCRGSCGTVHLTEPRSWINGNAMVVQPTNGTVDLAYLAYALKGGIELADAITGTAQPQITRTSLMPLTISFPDSLPEQQRIVTLLDEAFAALATAKTNAEQNLRNTHALLDSQLESIFSQRGADWEERRIEDWCESVMDCVNKTAPVVETPTPFKMLRTTNIRNGKVDVSAVKYVTEETYKTWTRRQIPQRGDVILTREAPMGEVGMILSDENVFLGQRLVSYRTNPKELDNFFLLYALQSRALQDQIHAKASGSTVQHMRVPDSKNLLLAAPSLQKQRAIVERLKALQTDTQHITRLYERKLAALEELRKALLHQAFNGEL